MQVMDRSWIKDGKKFTGPYMKGCKEFMAFVRQHANAGEVILCPCTRCHNLVHHEQKDVLQHINCNGMSMHYTRWIFHGEAFSDDDSHSEGHGAYDSENDEEYDDTNENNYVDDAYNMVHELEKSGKKGPNQPNFFQSYWMKPRESFMRDAPLIQGWHLL